MRVFIDTEFTDLVDMDLISIGLVADDGSEFYGERSDFDLAKCNNFVRSKVLPILNRDPAAVFTCAGLSAAVGSWLDQLASKNPVLCYDFLAISCCYRSFRAAPCLLGRNPQTSWPTSIRPKKGGFSRPAPCHPTTH